jgi:hypothetical protein
MSLGARMLFTVFACLKPGIDFSLVSARLYSFLVSQLLSTASPSCVTMCQAVLFRRC